MILKAFRRFVSNINSFGVAPATPAVILAGSNCSPRRLLLKNIAFSVVSPTIGKHCLCEKNCNRDAIRPITRRAGPPPLRRGRARCAGPDRPPRPPAGPCHYQGAGFAGCDIRRHRQASAG
nr:MAG TPA: hypothetical protein [Caudoviricetes sp.]